MLPADLLHSEKTQRLLLKVTCICWLAAKLIGWRMFTTYRLFPTAPVFTFLDNIPAIVHTCLYAASVLSMLALLVIRRRREIILVLLVCEIFSCLLDQNRIQPWDYQYLFILLLFIVFDHNIPVFLTAFVIILASTYVYSGLGKLNTGFLQTIWSRMILRQFLGLTARATSQRWLYLAGLFIGLFESLSGFLLLFSKTRKAAALALIVMHVFILVLIGPFGIRYNPVVWPWNIAMIAYLLSIRGAPGTVKTSFNIFSPTWNTVIFIFWGILPAFSFFGLWDNYLSSGIYSGNVPQMVIRVKDTAACKPLRHFLSASKAGGQTATEAVNLQSWSMSETNMAPYPEIRAYKVIATKLLTTYPNAGFTFSYYGKR
jgi:hypothetical protein